MRKIPDCAVKIVADFEGFEPAAYLCPARVWTIGYGHTNGVKPGDTVTEEKAREMLRADLGEAANKLYALVPAPVLEALDDNQWGALLSFVYNVGLKREWGIVRDLNGGVLDNVPTHLRKFVYAGGKKLKGLVRRREAEVALWLTI